MENKIRVVSLGVIRRGNHILAHHTMDKSIGRRFWRIIGGGVEFGETSKAAVEREFMEELGVKVIVGEKLCVLEQFFSFYGNQHHEITFVYNVEFADTQLYQKEEFQSPERADKVLSWVDIDTNETICPEGLLDYL